MILKLCNNFLHTFSQQWKLKPFRYRYYYSSPACQVGSLKRSTVAIRSGYDDLLSEPTSHQQQAPIDIRWGELLWCNFIDSEIPSWNPGRRQNLHPSSISSSRLWRGRWPVWWHKTHLNIKMLLPEGRACCDQATDTETDYHDNNQHDDYCTMDADDHDEDMDSVREEHGWGWSLCKSLPQNDSWQRFGAICNLFDKFL